MRRAQPWLGTFVEIEVDIDRTPLAIAAVDAAFERIAAIHASMSYHLPDSDLSRLNRALPGVDVRVGADTWHVMRMARELHLWSDGLFDCAVAGTLVRAGLLPRAQMVAMDDGTQADIELAEPQMVRKLRPVCLDLGGIAKGFAVDAAVDVLQQRGITAGSVNAGGDMRVFGPTPRRIDVRDPRHPSRLIPLVDLQDAALATSAGYFVARDAGTTRSALVDPRQRRCVATQASISVLAPSCMLADALTKVVALSGDVHHPLLDACGAQALVLDPAAQTSSMLSRKPRWETSPQSTSAHIEPLTEKVLRLALSSV